jgi:sporulation protein YlmC with PRC-barrel domain
MRRVSELLSKPLISLLEGGNEGVIKNIAFDKRLKKPKWLIFYDDSNERAIRISDIFKVGQNAVVIKTRESIVALNAAEGLVLNNPINCTVYTSDGKEMGRVKDVVLRDDKDEVLLLELDDFSIPADQIFSSSGDTVVILEKNEALKISRSVGNKKTAQQGSHGGGRISAGGGNAGGRGGHADGEKINIKQSDTPVADLTYEAPYKDRTQKKLIGDYKFLLGRKTNRDIFDKKNIRIIKKNSSITADVVNAARLHGKLIELTVNSLPPRVFCE